MNVISDLLVSQTYFSCKTIPTLHYKSTACFSLLTAVEGGVLVYSRESHKLCQLHKAL